MVYQDRIHQQTAGHGDMHDITAKVQEIVAESNVSAGLVNVHVIGSTGVIGTIEFERGLLEDLPQTFDRLMPPSREYKHELTWQDGNGHSHLQATTLGSSITIPIGEGKPILGTWQQIFLMECDVGPRARTVVITVMGTEAMVR